jgi:acetyltransferase-like isoleucine patch superfamily enzyme
METSANFSERDLGLQLRLDQRLLMLALNYVPLMHVLAVAAAVGVAWAPYGWRILAGGTLLFVVPALAARALHALIPIPGTHVRVGTHAFFAWWAMANLQMLFSRIPAIEEALRLVPGLYSTWLRLWGARIGRLTYWGAGLRILDRSFLHIGDDVIFGAAVRLNPHVLARNEQGELELILAPIVIGDRSVVGGYSLLTAGTELAADECTRAFLVSPPFSHWRKGKRVSKAGVSA